jgi:hypothetical protein
MTDRAHHHDLPQQLQPTDRCPKIVETGYAGGHDIHVGSVSGMNESVFHESCYSGVLPTYLQVTYRRYVRL